jgi:sialic acid synthase SpsE/mannose-6-phosphate isomerase-like protein (cupin superfamily)
MKPLFVFEMANNHMGEVSHGLQLIKAIKDVCSEFESEFDFGFKLQYRDLDTFIHASFKHRDDLRYIKRFKETRLDRVQLRELVNAIRQNGFKTVCTPFDESSVGLIEEHDIEFVKIASCSFTDWPLLERIARTDKPIIASTAAASVEDIDRVVSFFQHRRKDLTIMHCVAEYPAPDSRLHIGQIAMLKSRYHDCRIGYSTHESPTNFDAVMLAVAAGAEVFEKHVGLPTEAYGLNEYSASPMQVHSWLSAAKRARQLLGSSHDRYAPSETELQSLLSLRRGVFVKRPVTEGRALTSEDVEFAFPAAIGQLTANDWSKYSRFEAKHELAVGKPVLKNDLEIFSLRGHVGDIVARVKELLLRASVVVPSRADLEISHHYGIERFDKFGLTMINVVNREYCKKILILLAGQTHPEQYHEKKEETFLLLFGDLELRLNSIVRNVAVGDVITVAKGVRHEFRTKSGCVIEEISSTHFKDDSYYTDSTIMKNVNRKTMLTYWM